jgi:phage terminase large subunit
MFKETTATTKIKALNKRIRAIQGGTSASKTISILLYLIAMAQTDAKPTLTSVVAESIPHLKRGAIRDFKNIMQTHGYWKQDNWSASDKIYTFETGSQIEFFSTDNGDKLRGARRDRLFMNECNNISLEAFEQLEVRTKQFVFLDWNPSNEFWFYTEVQGLRDDVEHIILTYKDNEALDQQIVDAIEKRKNNTNWWQVYGLGQLGEVQGRVFTGWRIVDDIPHEARLVRRGMDFGYSNDPTAIIDIYYYNGGYILDEICYQKGLSNKQIADIIKSQEDTTLVRADSAEPKSIDEIRSYGVNITPAPKGKGSVNFGIQYVQDQRISVTKRSVNLIKEYRNYLWKTDKNGRILNEPEDLWNHCFAPETLIHTTKGKKRIDQLVGQSGFLYTRGGLVKRFKDVRATREDAETITIHFTDGTELCVTPDHLLLLPNGEWKEAGLLNHKDLIQSVMYGDDYKRNKTRVSWKGIHKVQWRKILQGVFVRKASVPTQGCLEACERRDTCKHAHTPQGSQQGQQQPVESGDGSQGRTSEQTHDTGEATTAERVDREDTTTRIEVAWVRRGDSVSQVAWKEVVGEKRTLRERVRTLPWDVYNTLPTFIRKVLSPELQNEGETKTIERITRGRKDIVYNLEVEGTHCMLANGVIAHNCMDATRYGMVDIKPNRKTGIVVRHGY